MVRYRLDVTSMVTRVSNTIHGDGDPADPRLGWLEITEITKWPKSSERSNILTTSWPIWMAISVKNNFKNIIEIIRKLIKQKYIKYKIYIF